MARHWAVTTRSFRASINIDVDSRTFGLIAVNYGVDPVRVNNILLLGSPGPGLLGGSASLTDQRADGGYFHGRVDIVIDAAATDPLVQITEMYDLPGPNEFI